MISRRYVLASCFFLTLPLVVNSQDIVPKGASLEKIFDDGVVLTEGVAVAPDGTVYFSDITFTHVAREMKKPIEAGHIWKFDPKTKKTTIFRSPSGMSNGIKFDADGQHDRRRRSRLRRPPRHPDRHEDRQELHPRRHVRGPADSTRPTTSPSTRRAASTSAIRATWATNRSSSRCRPSIASTSTARCIASSPTPASRTASASRPIRRRCTSSATTTARPGIDRLPKDANRSARAAWRCWPTTSPRTARAKFRKMLVDYAPQDGPDGLVVRQGGQPLRRRPR